LDTNDTEIQVCANNDHLNTPNHGTMTQEVLVCCKAYDVEMTARSYVG